MPSPRSAAFVIAVLTTLCAAGAQSLPPVAPSDAGKYQGQTEPAAKVEVPSVQRGRLADVVAKEGDAIKKGDIIARLDTNVQEATVKLQQFKADNQTDIKFAKVALEYARVELEKYQKAEAGPADIRTKELSLRQAEAYLAKTVDAQETEKLALAREKIVLENMTIRSPIDGFVHRLNKQAGESIDENQPLAVVVQTNLVVVSFFLPEQLFGKIKTGEKATVELATTPPMVREAKVVSVDPYVDPAGHLFRVKMHVDNADGKLPVGIAASWVMGK